MAIVIDDMGEDLSKAERLIEKFGSFCTFSILPYCPYSKKIASLAHQNGLDILVHLPLEPIGYPTVDPGPGALLVAMDNSTIVEILQHDLDQIPGAVGVNNHMGSRFTAHKRGILLVLLELKKRNLFFMDSLTNSKSKVKELSAEIGIPIVRRDIFIDNQQQVEEIVFQLKEAENLAKITGEAIALGHPYDETLIALSKWSDNRDQEIQLCKLSELVETKN